jgi:hypothetical protein
MVVKYVVLGSSNGGPELEVKTGTQCGNLTIECFNIPITGGAHIGKKPAALYRK